MKVLITLLAALLMTSFSAFSQEIKDTKVPGSETYQFVEHMPEAPYNVNEFLSRNIDYPWEAMSKGISGRVVLRYVIDEDGVINDITVQKSVCPSIDSEAVRVVRSMPKWKPGRDADNKPVKVYFTLPIKFSMDGGGIPPPLPYSEEVIKAMTYVPPRTSGPVLTYVEQMPEPGVSINSYIASQVTSSNIEELVGTKGRVVLKFIVTSSGDLDSFKVIKSLNPMVDTLAMDILNDMPMWTPGMNEGKAVNVYYTVPIPFNFTADTSAQQPLTRNTTSERGNNDTIYSYVNQLPEAGYDFNQYLSRSISYPQKARNEKTEGRVVLRFVITKTGKIENITVQQRVTPELDAEAVRVIKEMPDWIPARHNNEPVNVYFTLPIKFSLH